MDLTDSRAQPSLWNILMYLGFLLEFHHGDYFAFKGTGTFLTSENIKPQKKNHNNPFLLIWQYGGYINNFTALAHTCIQIYVELYGVCIMHENKANVSVLSTDHGRFDPASTA